MIKWCYKKSNYTSRGLQVKSRKTRTFIKTSRKQSQLLFLKKTPKDCSRHYHANIINETTRKSISADIQHTPTTQLTRQCMLTYPTRKQPHFHFTEVKGSTIYKLQSCTKVLHTSRCFPLSHETIEKIAKIQESVKV